MRGKPPAFTRPEELPASCPTLRAAARALGMSWRTLEAWKLAGRIEPSDDGTWDPAAILEEAEASIENRSDSPEAHAWRIEKLKWSAKVEKLRHDRLESSLVSLEEVSESRAAQVRVLKESLLPIASKVAAKIATTTDKREIASAIESEVLKVIRIYAGEG